MPGKTTIKRLKAQVKRERRLRAVLGAKKLQPFAPSVGKSTRSRLGVRKITKKRGSRTLACWDATHPSHLALPRAISPYAVIRTTRSITSTDQWMMLGAFTDDGGIWMNIAGISCVNMTAAINSTSNWNAYAYSGVPLNDSEVVPSAVTVQVMCGQSINNQANEGIIYGAVTNTHMDLSNDGGQMASRASEWLSFMKPRLLSAPKLTLRGVKMSSRPLDMSDLASFTRVTTASSPFTWTGGLKPAGWSPLCVYNPDGASLTYLVTTEWRTRFEIGNPAVATHTYHPPTTDAVWGHLTQSAADMGHGVVDMVDGLADVVASAGNAGMALVDA